MQTMHAQQPWFTQFNENNNLLNPALTGHANHLTIRSQYKLLWTSIDASPKTAIFGFQTPIGSSNSAVGINFSNDQFGVMTTSTAIANYAYRFTTSIGKIACGTAIIYQNYSQALLATKPAMADDPVLSANYNAMYFNAGLGVAWEGENGYVGVGFPTLLSNSGSGLESDATPINPVQLNITGAYTFALNNDWDFTPEMSYNYINNLPSQLAILFLIEWKKTAGIIAGYRTNNAYSVGMQCHFLENFILGYTYDYFTSNIGSAGGGHELLLGFDLNKNKGE